MERISVLLDTDPGNDIDDVLAIGYLLKQPRCELLGITTVTGNVGKRAALAEVICQVCGREDVPIVAGRGDVLAYGPGQDGVAQYEAIEHVPHRRDYRENQAVDFLRSQIRSRPGEIVLATIGPFSNIGLLFALDPEIPQLLRGIVSMAGAFFGYNHHETNCIVDPAATAMVVRTPRPRHAWYGLDVTMQVVQSHDEVLRRYVGEPLATILPMAKVWFRGTGNIVYHDPLAVASIFEPSICQYQMGRVEVEPSSGDTTFVEGAGTDRIAVAVDREKFFEEFFGIIGA